MRATLRLALLPLAAMLLVGPGPVRAASPTPCDGRGTAIVVALDAHRLALCDEGRLVATHRVALGRSGVGKRREGDGKTPVGTYPLGAPRSSSGYHTFIPVGYPTGSERTAGYTGGDVGIHGPARGTRFLGPAGVAVDWTLGCIAVASDEEIDAIAAFVRRARVRRVVLE